MKITTKDPRVKKALPKRIFTNDELSEIMNFLTANSMKDDQMPVLEKLRGTEWFPILQDDKNKKVAVTEILEYIASMLAPVVGVAITLQRYDTVDALRENSDLIKSEILPKLKEIYTHFDPHFKKLIEFIKSLYEALELSLDSLDSEIGNLSSNVTTIVSNLSDQINSFWSTITETLSKISTSLTDIQTDLNNNTIVDTLEQYISSEIESQTTTIENYISDEISALETLINNFSYDASEDINTITEKEIDSYFSGS